MAQVEHHLLQRPGVEGWVGWWKCGCMVSLECVVWKDGRKSSSSGGGGGGGGGGTTRDDGAATTGGAAPNAHMQQPPTWFSCGWTPRERGNSRKRREAMAGGCVVVCVCVCLIVSLYVCVLVRLWVWVFD